MAGKVFEGHGLLGWGVEEADYSRALITGCKTTGLHHSFPSERFIVAFVC